MINITKMIPIYCAMVFLFFGCSNAIYFYETEKISISFEARPEAAQMVSGNIGVKQRVALMVPPKSDDSKSMISKFDLRIEDKVGWDAITIESVLLTGSAATTPEGSSAQDLFKKLAN